MNKRLLVVTLAAACGACAVSATALAQQTANGQNTAPSAIPAAKTKLATQRAVPPVDSRMCVRDTGSHIPPPKGQCLPVNGNSYSAQDIQRTGALDIGQALRRLDPRVTVHGH